MVRPLRIVYALVCLSAAARSDPEQQSRRQLGYSQECRACARDCGDLKDTCETGCLDDFHAGIFTQSEAQSCGDDCVTEENRCLRQNCRDMCTYEPTTTPQIDCGTCDDDCKSEGRSCGRACAGDSSCESACRSEYRSCSRNCDASCGAPSSSPSEQPTSLPTSQPSHDPTALPSVSPTSRSPTDGPTPPPTTLPPSVTPGTSSPTPYLFTLEIIITGAPGSHLSMNELYLCADDWCEDDVLSLDPPDGRIESLNATQSSLFGPAFDAQKCLDADEGTTCSTAMTSSSEQFILTLTSAVPELVRAVKIVHYSDDSERPVEVSGYVDGVRRLRESFPPTIRSTWHHILPILSVTRYVLREHHCWYSSSTQRDASIIIRGRPNEPLRIGEIFFLADDIGTGLDSNSSAVWALTATQSSNAYSNESLADDCIDNDWSTFCETQFAGSDDGETLNVTLVTYEDAVGVDGFVTIVNETDLLGYPMSFSLLQGDEVIYSFDYPNIVSSIGLGFPGIYVIRVYGHIADYLTLDNVVLCDRPDCSGFYLTNSLSITVSMSSEYPGWPAENCIHDQPGGCSTDFPGTYGQAYFEMTWVGFFAADAIEITNHDSSQWQAAAVTFIENRKRVFNQLDISNSTGRTVIVPIP